MDRNTAIGLIVCAALLTGCGAGPELRLPDVARFTLEGRVTTDGAGVNPASVILSGSPVGGFTGPDGRFRIEEIRPGSYRMTVVYLGLRSDPLRLTLPGPADTTATLPMNPDPGLGPALRDLESVELSVTISGSP